MNLIESLMKENVIFLDVQFKGLNDINKPRQRNTCFM